MNLNNITTGNALHLMNFCIRNLDPRCSRPLRRCRHIMVRRWLRAGMPIRYTKYKLIPRRHVGIAVRREMLLTDSPRLFDAIAAGDVPGYMAEDDNHPATQWVVVIGDVWMGVRSKEEARALFEWQLARQHVKLQEADHDAN